MGCGASKNAEIEKTAAERKAAWETIRYRLPRSKTPEDKERRIALFKKFDRSKSDRLSLDDTYKGCINVLRLDDFTPRARDIVKRAFNKAKDMGTQDRDAGSEDYVEFLEFRLLLCYIYDYFELTVMFDELDTSGNMLLDEKEFKKAAPKIEEWGLKIKDPSAVFNEIDANGSGSVTFDEFAAWATSKKLELDA